MLSAMHERPPSIHWQSWRPWQQLHIRWPLSALICFYLGKFNIISTVFRSRDEQTDLFLCSKLRLGAASPGHAVLCFFLQFGFSCQCSPWKGVTCDSRNQTKCCSWFVPYLGKLEPNNDKNMQLTLQTFRSFPDMPRIYSKNMLSYMAIPYLCAHNTII